MSRSETGPAPVSGVPSAFSEIYTKTAAAVPDGTAAVLPRGALRRVLIHFVSAARAFSSRQAMRKLSSSMGYSGSVSGSVSPRWA